MFDEIITVDDNDLVPTSVICIWYGISKNVFDGLDPIHRGYIVHQYYLELSNKQY